MTSMQSVIILRSHVVNYKNKRTCSKMVLVSLELQNPLPPLPPPPFPILELLGLGVVIAVGGIGAFYWWKRNVEPQEDGTVESNSSTVETEPQLPVSYNIYIYILYILYTLVD